MNSLTIYPSSATGLCRVPNNCHISFLESYQIFPNILFRFTKCRSHLSSPLNFVPSAGNFTWAFIGLRRNSPSRQISVESCRRRWRKRRLRRIFGNCRRHVRKSKRDILKASLNKIVVQIKIFLFAKKIPCQILFLIIKVTRKYLLNESILNTPYNRVWFAFEN